MTVRLHNIIVSLAPQGAQNMLLRLLSRIDRRRFAPVVTSLLDNVPLLEQFRAIDVPVHVIGLRTSRTVAGALWQLVKILRSERPHIVQTWLYHADLLGSVATRMAGDARLVWNIRHSNLEPEVNSRSTLLAARAGALLSRRVPDRIVCCAEAARQSHVRFGYDDRRMQVIPNGFDLDRLTPQPQLRAAMRRELGLDDQTLAVGLIARYHPQKDHDNFLAAAARLLSDHPDTRLVLAGDDIDAGNRRLADAIRRHGVGDKTLLLGRCNQVPRLLAALDVLASSSLGEGFPNAVGEAMACAVPCAVTDVGDSARLVGDTGLVVPPRDPAALGDALARLARMGEGERRQLGARARARIDECFSLPAVVARYERLYEELTPGFATPRKLPSTPSTNSRELRY